jgi:hypothetical protein
MSETERLGFSIRIFIPSGIPDGLKVVEKSNWTGRAIVCPRSQFPAEKSRFEFDKPGVYVLFGRSPDADRSLIYVGEGDPVRPRLEQHFVKKDFWVSMIVFVSMGENLNKAQVQYLEARLVQLARDAKRCVLDNTNTPQLPSLSEADTADVEGFLREILLIYPVLGVLDFEKAPILPPSKRILLLRGKETSAKGYESSQGFVVLADSIARAACVSSAHGYLKNRRDLLVEQGILAPTAGGGYRLKQDYVFDSPSTAAGVMLGRSANGRVEWKDSEGRTLKTLQERAVGQVED